MEIAGRDRGGGGGAGVGGRNGRSGCLLIVCTRALFAGGRGVTEREKKPSRFV